MPLPPRDLTLQWWVDDENKDHRLDLKKLPATALAEALGEALDIMCQCHNDDAAHEILDRLGKMSEGR